MASQVCCCLAVSMYIMALTPAVVAGKRDNLFQEVYQERGLGQEVRRCHIERCEPELYGSLKFAKNIVRDKRQEQPAGVYKHESVRGGPAISGSFYWNMPRQAAIPAGISGRAPGRKFAIQRRHGSRHRAWRQSPVQPTLFSLRQPLVAVTSTANIPSRLCAWDEAAEVRRQGRAKDGAKRKEEPGADVGSRLRNNVVITARYVQNRHSWVWSSDDRIRALRRQHHVHHQERHSNRVETARASVVANMGTARVVALLKPRRKFQASHTSLGWRCSAWRSPGFHFRYWRSLTPGMNHSIITIAS